MEITSIFLLWIVVIQTNSGTRAMFRKCQHEAPLMLSLNCRPQGGLENSRKECTHGKKSLDDHMVIRKSKVTSGTTWCSVSHGVSPKGVFYICSKSKR